MKVLNRYPVLYNKNWKINNDWKTHYVVHPLYQCELTEIQK